MPGQRANVLFRTLQVNVVENTSGIFIGTNQAIGWRSYGKTNEGFGKWSGGTLTNAVSAVFDSDGVDAPTHEVRNIRIVETPEGMRQTNVGFRAVEANAVTNGSAIGLGNNGQPGWSSVRKNNYGNGRVTGGNWLRQFASFAIDNDAVDAPTSLEGGTFDVSGAGKNIRIVQNTEER